jgi:2-polyprenyl-6-methoxyphenol hydroxylase-like FAD-dependent oxidoreductase
MELKIQCKKPEETMAKETSESTGFKMADLLIAADGVHSSVVSKLAPQCEPRSLHVGIVLGISENFNHALLRERGFYTVDGKHRLFIMPYEGDQFACKRRVMWQLSYRLDNEEEEEEERMSNVLRNPEILRDKVLNICAAWHQPVTSMIQATPLDTIWGT